MGRGQSRTRAVAANRKAGAQKRSMKAAVKRAQRGLKNAPNAEAKAKQRREGIKREDYLNRMGNKRQLADEVNAIGHSRSSRRSNSESMMRRDETAPRYGLDGKPTGVRDFGRLNHLGTRAPKYRNRYKDIDGTRKGGAAGSRRDTNSRNVGGPRARDHAARSRAVAQRARRNQRRRQRYAERKAQGRNAPKSGLRQRPGLNRNQVDALLRNFYPTWEVQSWRLN